MIAALLVLAGLILLVIPGLFGVPLRLPAAEWTRIAAASLLVGFVVVEVGLTLLALPALLRALHAAGIASVCDRVLTPLALGGDAAGWASGALATVIAVRAWRSGKRAHQGACAAEVEPWLGQHEDRGAFELVVLPTDHLLAVSVPATRPQVLISDGLINRLDSAQLEAVIRHEATHHRCQHWRFSLLAASVERAFSLVPLVRRSTAALRTSLESWADEAAAGDTVAGRAVIRGAIVAVAGPVEGIGSKRVGHDVVWERARRLENSYQPRAFGVRLMTHAPVILLSLTAFVFLAEWLVGAHGAAALTGYCAD